MFHYPPYTTWYLDTGALCTVIPPQFLASEVPCISTSSSRISYWWSSLNACYIDWNLPNLFLFKDIRLCVECICAKSICCKFQSKVKMCYYFCLVIDVLHFVLSFNTQLFHYRSWFVHYWLTSLMFSHVFCGFFFLILFKKFGWQKYWHQLQTREERFRYTSDSINLRVFWWSVTQVSALVVVGIWQSLHLKNFFIQKKLV